MIDIGELQGTISINGVNEAMNNINSLGASSSVLAGHFESLQETAKKMLGAFAIGTVFKTAASSAQELQVATNNLSNQLGATGSDMEGLKDSLENIYKGNYGESFEDIAQAMADVSQQTKMTGESLEDATKSAMLLRDTFGWEVNESIRAVDMMMKQFGVTSEEAFNLIAQGAQNGLDKNDNLLDSINEYSVHFKQLGFDAEEMFNMFSNGAQTGVFDIDKLGDAVKEFGIRVKDGTADDAFKELNLNADKLKEAFSQGGEAAQEAFNVVNQALIECDDKVTQNTLGVTMYGTMWEDLGVQAIQALTDVNGSMDASLDVLSQINEIRYDDFNSALSGIGRQLEVDVIIPFGERLLPYLNEFANWLNENSDTLVDGFGQALDTVANAVDFLAENLDTIIPIATRALSALIAYDTLTTLVDTFNSVKAGAEGLANAFMLIVSNPVALAITGIAAAIGVLSVNIIEASVKQAEYNEKLLEAIQMSNDFTSATNSEVESMENVVSTLEEQIGSVEKYGNAIASNAMQMEALEEQMQNVDVSTQEGIDTFNELNTKYNELAEQTKALNISLEDNSDAIGENREALEEEYGSVENAKKVLEGYKDRLINAEDAQIALAKCTDEQSKALMEESLQLKTTASQAQALLEEQKRLSSQTNMTSSEQKRLGTVNQELQSILGDSVMVWDAERQQMVVNTAQAETLISSLNRTSQAKANQCNTIQTNSAYIKQASVDECNTIIEACKKEIAALEARAAALGAVDDGGDAATQALAEQRDKAAVAMKQAQARLEELNAATVKTTGATNAYAGAVEDAGKKASGSASKAKTAEELKQEAINKTKEKIKELMTDYEYMSYDELQTAKTTLKQIENANKDSKEIISEVRSQMTNIAKEELARELREFENNDEVKLDDLKSTLESMKEEYSGYYDVVEEIEKELTDVAKEEVNKVLENFIDNDEAKIEDLMTTLEDMKTEYGDYSDVVKEIESALSEAIEEEYERRSDELESTLDRMKEMIDDFYGKRADELDAETQAQIDALEKENEAIKAAQEERERIEKEAKLQKAIAEAEDEEARREAEQAYTDWLADQQVKRNKAQIDAIKAETEAKKEAMADQQAQLEEMLDLHEQIEQEKLAVALNNQELSDEEVEKIAKENVERRNQNELDLVDQMLQDLLSKTTDYKAIGEEHAKAYIDGIESVGLGIDDMLGNVNIDGSHATGLDYVPFNGYRAELHRGEMVLTKEQATSYRNGETSNIIQTDNSSLESKIDKLIAAVNNVPRQMQINSNMA